MHTHHITRNVVKATAPTFARIHDDMLEEMAAFFGTDDFGMIVDTIDIQGSLYIKVEAIAWIDDDEEDDDDYDDDEDNWPTPNLDDLFDSGTYWPWC